MSPSLSHVDIKHDLDLDFDQPDGHGGDDPLPQSGSPAINGSADPLDAIAAPHSLLDSAPFGDFDFSYQDLAEPEPLVGFDNHAASDVFAPSPSHDLPPPPAPAAASDRRNSATSITVQTSGLAGPADRRGQSVDGGSDGDTSDSLNHGANSLEDPVSDEFGLAGGSGGPSDPTAGLGSRAKGDKPDAAPAWSELKTKAGKERKRLPLACIACRRKKIRCSGEKPACKHCLRSRIPCVYKVTARKAAPRTDYMAMLDKRLKRMEDRIIKIVPKADQDSISASVPRAVVRPAIPGTLSASAAAAAKSASSTSKKRNADDAFGADLDHWARTPPKSRLGGPDRPSSLMVQEAEESKLLLEGGDALPSKDIQEHLAEVFFENLYGQAYYLLHRPSYMRKLRAGTLPPVLVLSVCAISARFSNHPKLNTTPQFLRGEEWASPARDILIKRYEWPNITILTCLLIMGLHEFGTCHGGRSWSLGGQAIRMAFALQLHKDLEYDPQRVNGRTQLSFIDREIRRRTMWACFVMDRFTSSGTDRPTFIHEDMVKIPLPIKEKYFQLDMPGPTETLTGQVLDPVSADDGQLADARENMGVAAYMIRVVSIWGRIITYINRGGKDADPHPMWSPESEYARLVQETEDLVAALPASLAYTPENLRLHEADNIANHFLFFHIAIQQNILFMNRFAVSSPGGTSQQDVPKAFVTKAGAKAFHAANRISELLLDAETHFVSAPFTGYCAFLSSTVHIFGIFSGNPSMEAASKRNLATNVKFLSRMKRYWGMFHWMAENLREQYRTCADAARQGNPANEKPASPIFQYGDWFDRYPHGVSGSDYMDPAAYRRKEKGDDAVLEQKPELHTVEEYFTHLSPGGTTTTTEAVVTNGGSGAGGPRAPPGHQAKRKSAAAAARKGSGGVGSRNDLQLDPLQTDAAAAAAAAAAVAAAAQHPNDPAMQAAAVAAARAQHHRTFSNSALAAGQTSGAAFNPLTVPHSANGTSYHALSPLSPVTVSQFGGPHHPHHHRHPHHPASFFPPDPFALPLTGAHQGGGGGGGGMALPQLDRQLVFGAYANSTDTGLGPLTGWPQESNGGGGGEGRSGSRASNGHSSSAGGGGTDPTLHSPVFNQEASSAWFMPFNMEPPEIGADLGIGGVGGLDGFVNMFGTSSGSGGGGGGMGGGMHHGSR